MTDPTTSGTPKNAPKTKANKTAIGCLAFALAPFLIIGTIFIIGAISGPADADAADAHQACETKVRAQLRAPSTARFSDRYARETDGGFSVSGSVDSQNGFGAMVRSNYVCAVTVNGEYAAADLVMLE